MANFAALIAPLAISGSRLSDGSPNASGKCWLFAPGTSTTVQGYSDATATTVVTQPITLGAGGRLPSNLTAGLFVTQPVRLYIEDASANVVSDTVFIPATAGDVGVSNAGFTDSNMNDVLTKALTSFGGQDFLYKESGGATSREVNDKFREIGIYVTDFPGVDPTGVGVSTTGIQTAMDRAKALSTNCIFPAGTYKTDQAITLSAASGVKVIGQGAGTTVIAPTHATANAFTFTACSASGISGMSILHTTGSTGAAVAIGGASPNFKVIDMVIPANGTYVGFAYCLDFSGASDFDVIAYCSMIGATRTIRINATSTAKPQLLLLNTLGASGAAPVPSTICIEFNGANGSYTLIGNRIVGNTSAILYNAAFTGTGVKMFSNDITSTSTPVIDMTAFAADRDLLRQWGNGVDGYVVSQASGGGGGSNHTPDRSRGPEIHIRLTSGGAAVCTVNAATPGPVPRLHS